MGDTGTYLSSFTGGFLTARELEDQRRRAEVREGREALQLKLYLDQLDRERGAERTLADVFRARSSSPPERDVPVPTGQGVAGPVVSQSPRPELLAGPPEPVVSGPTVAAGGFAAAQRPRPPVSETVFGGITPEARARFLTTRLGRATLPDLEASERERRQEEDRTKAEARFDQAAQAVADHQPIDWADHMAAGYRLLGRHELSARMMEVGVKARMDKDEQEQAPKDFEAIHTAVVQWKEDPSPQTLAKIHETMAGAKSVTAKTLGLEMTKSALSKALSADPDEDAFFRHATMRSLGPNRVPVEQAWTEAMEKYPRGFAKLWQQDILHPDKGILPDFVREQLRLPPRGPDKRDQTITQRAWYHAKADAEAKGIRASSDNPVFMRLWETAINDLQAAEHSAKTTPEEREKAGVDLEHAKDRAAMTKLRRVAMETPEDLAKKTSAELTLLIQRTSADLVKGDLSPEEERETKDYLAVLRKYRDAKAKDETRVPSAPGDTKTRATQLIHRLFPGKTWDQLTPAQKQRVADGLR